jgi:hypothetical protein
MGQNHFKHTNKNKSWKVYIRLSLGRPWLMYPRDVCIITLTGNFKPDYDLLECGAVWYGDTNILQEGTRCCNLSVTLKIEEPSCSF